MCACVFVCVCVSVSVCVCVCVYVCAEVTEVYGTMSGLPIVSDRAATKGSKYFKLRRQANVFF